MDITSVFQGVSTPPSELITKIENLGWEITTVKFDKKLNQYVAEATGPFGATLSKFGPDEGTALANVLVGAARRNHVKSKAMYKVGMKPPTFTDKMKDIAEDYSKAPIYDPKAAIAFKALADDSSHRARVLAQELAIEHTNDPTPYKDANSLAQDIKKRKYKLSLADTQHPIWTRQQVLDFRLCHDILGHVVSGGGFDWNGRNLALAAHLPLLNAQAQKALFSEVLGRSAYNHVYGTGPHRVALLDKYLDPHQDNPNYHGTHPSQTMLPVEEPEFKRAAVEDAVHLDPNYAYKTGVEPLQYNAMLHHGDPLQAAQVMATAAKVDTNWPMLSRALQKQAIVNAFRVVLLSPRKDLKWNAIHYQHISSIPADEADPKVYWEKLEQNRRDWNAPQGVDPDAHMPYFKFLRPFQALWRQRVLTDVQNGKLKLAPGVDVYKYADDEARRIFFQWQTEHQEALEAEDEEKPSHKQRNADEIERRANERLAKQLKMFMSTGNVETDFEKIKDWERRHKELKGDEETMSLFGRVSNEEWLQRARDSWNRYRGMEEYKANTAEWVPTHELAKFMEYDRRPGGKDFAGSEDYWNALGDDITEHGFNEPVFIDYHPEENVGHLSEGNHRVQLALERGIPYVPAIMYRSRRNSERKVPLTLDESKVPIDGVFGTPRLPEMFPPSWAGIPVREQNPNYRLGAGQYNLLTGEEDQKYGAFMGSHLKAIAKISQYADEILDAALEDVNEHDATGHHFRQKVLSLGVSGVGPKVCSFAWLLLCPKSSQLATIDTHMMDVLGHDYEKDMNNRDYFKFERELQAGRDASGYGDIPLGAFQWGMWDFKRTGAGSHQDHSAMRVLDPLDHNKVNWASKALNLKGDQWSRQAPDWWQNTQPARDQVADQWDETFGKSFPKNSLPYQSVDPDQLPSKIAYGEPFSYWWDKETPIPSYDIEMRAKKLAEYAAAKKKTKSDMEEWMDKHKADTHLSDSSFKKFRKEFFEKFNRINKHGATGRVPFFDTGDNIIHGRPGQTTMQHLVEITGMSPQEIWQTFADDRVGKS